MEKQETAPETYIGTTRSIRITVRPAFLLERSDVERGVYAYSYTITMENLSDETVQLVNRHWIVISAGRQIADVKGEGVVGEQPVLNPGEAFEYSSGTVVQDPVGSMYGTYTFVTQSGEFFNVEIPEFSLIYMESSTIH